MDSFSSGENTIRDAQMRTQSTGKRIFSNDMSFDFRRIEALTFDCYGTLIDWESGLLNPLRPIAGRGARAISDDELLAILEQQRPQSKRALPALSRGGR